MTLTLPKTCSMGSSKTGLVGTIGVALLNPDGTVHTARATANIYEIGGGCYGKQIGFDDDWLGSIKWDTGGGTPVYAVEEYIYYENNPNLDATVSSRAQAGEYNTQMGYIPSNLGDVPTDSELDAAHGSGSWESAVPPTPSSIADAVWDEDLTEHTTTNTAGKILQQIKSVVGAILGLIS